MSDLDRRSREREAVASGDDILRLRARQAAIRAGQAVPPEVGDVIEVLAHRNPGDFPKNVGRWPIANPSFNAHDIPCRARVTEVNLDEKRPDMWTAMAKALVSGDCIFCGTLAWCRGHPISPERSFRVVGR